MELKDLNKLPKSLLRVGNITILSTMCLFFSIVFFIRYSENLIAKVVLVTENPPVRVFSKSAGKLTQLLVKDKQEVNKDQILGILESTTDLKDVEKLEIHLDQLDLNFLNTTESVIPEGLILGSMQNSYASLIESIKEYKHFLSKQGITEEKTSITNQIKQITYLNQSLQKQLEILTIELNVSKKHLDRNKELFAIKSVSAFELETAEINYLQKERQLEDIQTHIINNNIRKEQLIAQNIELEQTHSNNLFIKRSKIREIAERLQSEIEFWEQTYIIKAPIAGIVSLSKVQNLFQHLNNNQEAFTIIPLENTGSIIAKCTLPIKGSGKVSEGSIANIKLDGYPYREFGTLKAQVTSIALVPDNEQYIVEMALPDNMTTSYNNKISFRQEMSGTAEIITTRKSFFDRIVYEMLNAANN